MKLYSLSTAATLLTAAPLIAAQTFTSCNPLHGTCPPDRALGKSENFDFTSGPSNSWTPTQSPSYGSNGVQFTVAKHGDSPLITSNFYIMFGHVDYVLQAAPGTGIVSSAVLQSDDLDEVDWEFLGGDGNNVQTNYFGKGITGNYNREITFPAPGNTVGFHTYSVDWTPDHIIWAIDGTTVRTLTPANADPNQFPQTPMMIKVGNWAGGDPSNAQGTITWAGGITDYGAGPFNMYVKSISVTDYSTGTQYKYTDQSGNWQSIDSVGGTINGNSGGAPPVATSATVSAVTSAVSGGPIPFSGTHPETSSTLSTATGTATTTTGPFLPSSSSVLTDSAPTGQSNTGVSTGTASGSSPTSGSSGSGSSSGSNPSASASPSVAAAPSAAVSINTATARVLATLCAVFVGALILL